MDDAIAVEVNNRPLVVDLDGTLINSGLLAESFLALLSSDPLRALSTIRHGHAKRKAVIAEAAAGDFHALAFNEDLLAFLRQEKAKGRRIYLTVDAHETLAQGIAAHTGLFDGIFASDGSGALRGAAKAELLCRTFGRGNFDYAGGNKADMDVWHAAAGVLVVGGSPGLIRTVSRTFQIGRAHV